jgi:DNA modification methylase
MIREHKGGRICYQKYDNRKTTVLDPMIGTETTGIAALKLIENSLV